jgi:DNA-binding transcriptional regulator YhcF (GntR family)
MAVRSVTNRAGTGVPAPPVAGERAARTTSWAEIERLILTRISKGVYKTGTQIPTCAQLAAEYGAHKNTVNKAYRSLMRRGYVSMRAGIGTFVTRKPARVDTSRAVGEVRELLVLAVQEAKLAGLDAAQLTKLTQEIVAAGFNRSLPRVGFVECNRLDATTLSRDLQSALKHPVQPLLIEDVLAEPSQHLRDYELLIVNLSHLAALEQGLRPSLRRGEAEIFGLHVPIDPDSLTQVARLRSGTRLGLVCDLEPTLHSLTGTVLGLNPALQITGGLAGDTTALHAVLSGSDVLLVTPSAASRIDLARFNGAVIAVAFQPSERAISELNERIANLREVQDGGRSGRAASPARQRKYA